MPAQPAPDTRRRVLGRIRSDTHVNEAGANRIFDGLLCYLDLCGAIRRGEVEPFATVPSALVDLAWHAFILHTHEYTDYCTDHCGGYVHHEPADPDSATVGDERSAEDLYARTRRAIEARFGQIDDEVWPA